MTLLKWLGGLVRVRKWIFAVLIVVVLSFAVLGFFEATERLSGFITDQAGQYAVASGNL